MPTSLDIFNTGNNAVNPNNLYNAGTPTYQTFTNPIPGVNVNLGQPPANNAINQVQPVQGPSNHSTPQSNNSGSLVDALIKGGYNRTDAENAAKNNYDALAREYLGIGTDDINKQVNDLYNPLYSSLNDAENNLKSLQPGYEQGAQNNYNLGLQQLGDSKTSSNNLLDTRFSQATEQKDNALADARRTFQEQQIGAQQRFGGSSSAGQAVSELQSRELARQFGQTNRQYSNFSNDIAKSREEVEKGYQTSIMELGYKKDAALQEIKSEFLNSWQQIQSQKAQLGYAKANAGLQLLQDMRNKIFQVNQAEQNFKYALELQKQQNLGYVNSYAAALTNQNSLTDQAFQQTSQALTTPGAGVPATAPSSSNQVSPLLTGLTGQTRKPNEDYYSLLA